MSNKRLSVAILAKMRKSYMDYVPATVIAEQFNVARTTVMHHIHKKWEQERGLLRAELYANLTQAKQADFNDITTNTIKILKRSLAHLADRADSPTLKEAVDSAKILDVLDKITRLDEGTPTDIISGEKPIEIVALRKRLAADPFQLEDATYKDVEDTDEESEKNSEEDN